MQGMRSIERAAEAVELIMERPWARKGYEDLASYYDSTGMGDEAEVVRFLVSERFGADHTSPDEEQREDHIGVP